MHDRNLASLPTVQPSLPVGPMLSSAKLCHESRRPGSRDCEVGLDCRFNVGIPTADQKADATTRRTTTTVENEQPSSLSSPVTGNGSRFAPTKTVRIGARPKAHVNPALIRGTYYTVNDTEYSTS